MERVISQEPKSDSGHSCATSANECDSYSLHESSNRVTSATALGLALSVGAFGALFPYHEAAIAADLPSAGRGPDLLSDSLKAASAPSSAPPLEVTAPSHHLVENGESLWQIAQQYQTDIQSLKAANGYSLENGLRIGLVLQVPSGGKRSLIQPSAPTAEAAVPAAIPEAGEISSAIRVEPPTLQPVPQAATLQSEDTFSPLMEPVAETEPTDPLRSAGLVSQSDGFKKELENLHSAEMAAQVEAEAASSVPSMPTDALSSTSAPADSSVRYQVRSGDTVGNIARSFGLSPEQLIQANAISNPDLIITGDQLVVPRTQAQLGVGGPAPTSTAAQSAEPSANETVLKREATERSERLARLQGSAVRPLESAQTDSTDGSAIAIASADAAGETEPTAAADPYVASLLQDVEAIQPDETPVVDAGSKMPEAAAEPANAEPANREAVVNPEFQPESQAQAPEPQQLAATDSYSSATTADTSELLAAAPLSPDAYAPPSSRPTAGQMVSPDMPLLPDADQYLPEAPDYFNGYIWPTRGTLTSGYGWRWGRMHRGVDVAGPVGTPIVAAAAGVIERSGWNSGGYGNLVDIRHSDGSMTRYAHNNRLLVRQGQPVRQGQQVAEMGSTGYSTGPHLHFEVHVPNQGAVNPIAHLPAR